MRLLLVLLVALMGCGCGPTQPTQPAVTRSPAVTTGPAAAGGSGFSLTVRYHEKQAVIRVWKGGSGGHWSLAIPGRVDLSEALPAGSLEALQKHVAEGLNALPMGIQAVPSQVTYTLDLEGQTAGSVSWADLSANRPFEMAVDAALSVLSTQARDEMKQSLTAGADGADVRDLQRRLSPGR